MIENPSPQLEQIVTLMRLMKKDIRTHFNIEEKLFFEVARETLPVYYKDILLNLTLEHEKILQDTDILIDSLEHRIENDLPFMPSLKKEIADLLEIIKEHAKFELTELFSCYRKRCSSKKSDSEEAHGNHQIVIYYSSLPL